MSVINAGVSSAPGWKRQQVEPSFRQWRWWVIVTQTAVHRPEEAIIRQMVFFTSSLYVLAQERATKNNPLMLGLKS